MPKDLIASNMKLKQVFTTTNTLRWEMRSTLTSDDEAAAKAKTEESSEEAEDIPKYPELLKNGIYEIVNADQHK